MTRICFYCQSNQVKKSPFSNDWVIEHQYLGTYGRILKKVLIGGVENNEKDRQPFKTVYYCSWNCSEMQADREEKELWEKGDCSECKKPLAVINDNCQDLEHKRLGCLFPIQNTPNCLKT